MVQHWPRWNCVRRWDAQTITEVFIGQFMDRTYQQPKFLFNFELLTRWLNLPLRVGWVKQVSPASQFCQSVLPPMQATLRVRWGIRGWFHQEPPKSLMGMEVALGTSKVLVSLEFGVGTLHRFASLESGGCNLWTITESFRSSVCSKTVSVVSLGCPER